MANTVDKVLKIAEAEVDYLEKSVSAYKKNPNILDKKTDGAGSDNYTKYGRDMHKIYPSVMDFPAAWCDAFVDWCFYKAYGVATAKSLINGNFDDYTVASCGMYDKKNALFTTPKVGDQVFFTKNGQVKGCYHTGLVYKVDGTNFYTIEGNTSGASGVVANGGGVAKKQYNISSYKGKTLFGRPKYDVKKNTTTTTKTTTTKKTYSGTFPTLPPRGYFKKGDKGTQVKNLQKFLNWAINAKLVVDGEIGDKTIAAVVAFQVFVKLVQDGLFGKNCLAKAKTFKK